MLMLSDISRAHAAAQCMSPPPFPERSHVFTAVVMVWTWEDEAMKLKNGVD